MAKTSLERIVLMILGCWGTLLTLACVTIVWLTTSQAVLSVAMALPFSILFGYLAMAQYNRLLGFYIGINGHLDALINGDHRRRVRQRFQNGVGLDIQDKLAELSKEIHLAHTRYDQSKLIIYDLLEELDLPMLILNDKSQLIRANGAFSNFSGYAWQLQKKKLADRFGLHQVEGVWEFVDADINRRWQIRHSKLYHDGTALELLIFIDQQSTIRKTQAEAWQKLIRVIKHEVGNSLTPIQSLSLSLIDNEALTPEGEKILHIIHNRAVGLLSFINAYVHCSKRPEPNYQITSIESIYQRVKLLFPEGKLELHCDPIEFVSDPDLLEQTLINLIKNAFEASEPGQSVVLNCFTKSNQVFIEVIDRGCGIQNLDNIQTPFYSTKENGQGLGLELCRSLVESQQGELHVKNRKNEKGAIARIVLPLNRPSTVMNLSS
ncbi:sensor histidine kinase [Pseudoalteromonas rubra]|uniref:sensor histidine kinase n=1 Tax=Pseudoalteromonas rubra TaxID=43658 RepID=UPI000F78F740|nr:ATP-binding protein [Pseudoalteromonas rubra]